MLHTQDVSYGVVPIYEHAGKREFLLVRHVHGDHWGFPKGHPNPGEEPKDSALRELREETGIEEIGLLDLPPVVRSYEFDGWAGDRVHKTVYFYLGRVSTRTVAIDPAEVTAYTWVTYEKLADFLTAPHEQFIRAIGQRLGS